MNRSGIIESVPNFSTSDPAVLDAIVAAMASVAGVRVLDRSADADHNRAVVTLAAPAPALLEALLAASLVALRGIDMRRHRGVHPRMGAIDVVPFVPLEDGSGEAVEAAAREFARRLWESARIPVYFYGATAGRSGRRALPLVRRGGFEGLTGRMAEDPPDVGDPAPHPSAGATAVGVRRPLIAFNVMLEKGGIEQARRIAAKVRESSGGLPGVQAMGVLLESVGRAQISMNVTDPVRTPLHSVVAWLLEAARDEGVQLGRAELIGLLPFESIRALASDHLLLDGLVPERILECAL